MGLVGPAVDLTYDYAHVGTDRAALEGLLNKDYGAVLDAPSVVIVGQGALREADGLAVLAAAQKLAADTNGKLMILHSAAARVGAMDIGAVTEGGVAAAIDGAEVIYNLGADEVEIDAGAFVIYQGSHGDRGARDGSSALSSSAARPLARALSSMAS